MANIQVGMHIALIHTSFLAVPEAPQNVGAAEVSVLTDVCIILVTWDHPANSNGSDIDHYILYVPSQNIKDDNETSFLASLFVPDCRDDIRIQVAAVNLFGCVGLNSTEVKPDLLDSPTDTTEDRSTSTVSK